MWLCIRDNHRVQLLTYTDNAAEHARDWRSDGVAEWRSGGVAEELRGVLIQQTTQP
jgi:hypothetical protein